MSGNVSQVREHMEVVGEDGGHVGTVDKVEGDRIKLTKEDDPNGSGPHHHYPGQQHRVRERRPGEAQHARRAGAGAGHRHGGGNEPSHGMGSTGGG